MELAGPGKRGEPKAGFHSLPPALGNHNKVRFPHSRRRDRGCIASPLKPKQEPSALRGPTEGPNPTLAVLVLTHTRAIPALMEAFWKPELPAPYWADCKLRLSQLRAPSMHAVVVDLAEALSPFLFPDIAPDLFRRRGFALC